MFERYDLAARQAELEAEAAKGIIEAAIELERLPTEANLILKIKASRRFCSIRCGKPSAGSRS